MSQGVSCRVLLAWYVDGLNVDTPDRTEVANELDKLVAVGLPGGLAPPGVGARLAVGVPADREPGGATVPPAGAGEMDE